MSLIAIVPDFLIAVLAAWLGASIVTRTPRAYVTRVFGLLTLLLALWGVSRLVWRLTEASSDWTVTRATLAAEAGVAALLPAALLHLVVAFTLGPRWRPFPRAAVLLAYTLGALVAGLSVTDLDHPIAVRGPSREVPGIPGPALGWGWIGVRALVLGLAVWWAWRAWRLEGPAGPRRGQLTALLGTVACGACGGLVTILLRQLVGPDWPGATLIVAGLVLATYAVFAHRAFLSPDVARRSLVASVGTGLLTAAYVGLLLGLERLSRHLLRIETPLVTAMALVLTIAFFDPVRQRLRLLWDRGVERRDLAYRRLLRALGDELLTSQRPEEAIAPALARLCRSLRISGAAVVAADGRPVAASGADPPGPAAAALALSLPGANGPLGQALFGPKETGEPYSETEVALLDEAAAFIGASLQLAERQASQAAALDTLSEERAALRAREDALAAALTGEGEPSPADGKLRVYALGPLRVERDGEVIQRWGGAKAGTRQAEAVFAFLFDRGERGVAKDEFVELIWPDVDLDKADLAFHRTLGGLRRILQPGAPRGEATAITYHNDRYRLDPALVGWSDVAAFQERLAAARAADGPAATIAALEEARALYRGEYLDDCPFYGDSEYVEERRALLRGRYVDLLLALGERYEAQGDLPAAAACYREALQAAGNDCPRAEDGLARLRLPA